MNRITALNEDMDSDCSIDDNLKVTKEAQETIAVSEYLRALKYKKENNIDNALILFRELLNVQILTETTKEHKDNKLFYVKYNCYKNLGFIHIDKNDTKSALDYLLSALELDDTDVFTIYKLGQLALNLSKLDVAQIAFEKCLKQNPNHWPSADGMLQVLCLKENYNDAYGWALTWYKKDKKYKRALNVILEIRDRFAGFGLEYIENQWPLKFTDSMLKRTNVDSVFPKYSIVEPEPIVQPDISELKINTLNWMSIGTMITQFYEKYDNNMMAICYDFLFDEFFMDSNSIENTITEHIPPNQCTNAISNIPNCQALNGSEIIANLQNDPTDQCKPNFDNLYTEIQSRFVTPTTTTTTAITSTTLDIKNQTSSETSADDSDNRAIDSSIDVNKPKQGRRRGSDLSFLEQWGWHKNRRYAQRKKSCEIDTTINGILRRILPKYFLDNFENEVSFNFQGKCTEVIDKANEMFTTTLSEFQEQTSVSFDEFILELKNHHFDQLTLIFKWLQFVSQFWPIKIPHEIKELYLNIYLLYLNHYDLSTWNLLDKPNFVASFRMTVFYLELFHDQAVHKHKFGQKNTIDELWFKLFNHLLFHMELNGINTDEYFKLRIRLYWLQYCVALYEYDLSRAVDWLETVQELMEYDENKGSSLELPNQIHNNKLDLKTIETIRITLTKLISINSVRHLYEANQFEQLVEIVSDSLTNSHKMTSHYNVPMKITTQFEILLESLWKLERFDECFIWSEKCLAYSLDQFLDAPQHEQLKWADSVNFMLIYIESLIVSESITIVSYLDKYYSRLIQSITRIVSNQFDVPFDKNNNRLHAINLKIPWVLLHYILQREEDLNMMPSRQPLGTCPDRDELEDTIPCSIMIFFTAHEFLGVRSWCTKYDGQLLLKTLDIVATKLRAPYLEEFREILAEYLEQVTYCLYGYPAKRARARHIEEHDATNIELTWERAIQLFDLYRPDQLPEFNSYKNDSISADMEQLLQRFVNVMPKQNDPNGHTTNIKNFISGNDTNVPIGVNCLPYKMNCIFYLLGDYYFKSRDFSKSIKYYILDLATCPTRFDSWAGLALSKTSKLETKLNSYGILCTNELLLQAKEALRCFKRCFELDKSQVPLWIEYGNLAYVIHSFCSRSLKLSSATLSMERFAFMEEKKDESLNIAFDCFTTVSQQSSKRPDENFHDEKWLYHYMLGKIAEKQKEHPEIFLEHYMKASKCLYEHNASYPFRISHSNPQNLSVEALEIFYRITSSIIKYVEQHSTVSKTVGKFFLKTLKEVGASPFALNQAKIDDNSINALKRKLSLVSEDSANKRFNNDSNMDVEEVIPNVLIDEEKAIENTDKTIEKSSLSTMNKSPLSSTLSIQQSKPLTVITVDDPTKDIVNKTDKIISPSRRGSQESSITTGTTTTTTGSDSTSTSSSTDSSSSDTSSSESESDSSEDGDKNKDAVLSDTDLESIYKLCIRNLEECVTRFPEHYKSIYRLVNIYLHATENIRDLKKCKQLLLGTYTTGLNNKIQGLFFDRKSNNFFNGIWRIPSTEIDRPGSFSAHLSKCVTILIEVLRLSFDHKILLEFALQIQRNPDVDKRYIKDAERKELFHQAISFCTQSFKNLMKKYGTIQRDDKELQTLMIDIYKAHKKCVKYMVQKENAFSALLIDAYKVYIEGKPTKIPENVSAIDFVIKICQHEIAARKQQEKNNVQLPGMQTEVAAGSSKHSFMIPTSTLPGIIGQSTMTTTPPIQPVEPQISTTVLSTTSHPIPSTAAYNTTVISTNTTATITAVPATTTSSLSSTTSAISRPRGRPPGSKNSNSSSKMSTLPKADPSFVASMMGLYNNPALISPLAYSDPLTVNKFLAEFYKLSNMTGTALLQQMGAANPQSQTDRQSVFSQPDITKFDQKSSLAATISNSAKLPSSTVMSIGSGQITITPSVVTAKSSQKMASNLSSLQKDKSNKVQISSSMSTGPSLSGSSISMLPEQTGNYPKGGIDFPKTLPKSLTITPTPAGYSNKMPIVNQHPNVTLQIEKPEINKPTKKKSQSFKSASQQSVPRAGSFGAYNLQDYTQQIALYNNYTELMKGLSPAAGLNFLAQFGSLRNPQNPVKSQTNKSNKIGRSQSLAAAASSLSASTSSVHSSSIKDTLSNKSKVSAIQQQQQQQKGIPRNVTSAMPKHFPTTIMSKQQQTMSGQSAYSMIDMTKGLSQFSVPGSTPPHLSPSPNKSPISHNPSVTPPASSHHQISPTKTLQQKLAERQKALMDANARSTAANEYQ